MNWKLAFSRGRVFIMLLSLSIVLCGLQAEAGTQVNFPAGKSITMILGTSAGGSTDIGARILAGPMEKVLGTRIQIENKPGAGWQIGLTALARSKPDGYTIGFAVIPQAITNYLDPDRKAVFNRKSFEYLGMQVVDPGNIAIRANSPYKTMKDLVEAAKANPGKLKASATGILSDDHLAILQLQRLANVKFAIVQFDGSAPAMTALLGGHTDVYFGNIGDTAPQFKAGEVRVLGVMDPQESPFLPGVKTVESQGWKLYSSSSRGLIAPAGVPKEIVQLFANAIKQGMDNEEHKKKMDEQGLTVRYMDPAQMEAYWTEMEGWVAPLVDEAKKK
jgi:tripartite-type tricarboxylate transporter receptor subunit TctC